MECHTCCIAQSEYVPSLLKVLESLSSFRNIGRLMVDLRPFFDFQYRESSRRAALIHGLTIETCLKVSDTPPPKTLHR